MYTAVIFWVVAGTAGTYQAFLTLVGYLNPTNTKRSGHCILYGYTLCCRRPSVQGSSLMMPNA